MPVGSLRGAVATCHRRARVGSQQRQLFVARDAAGDGAGGDASRREDARPCRRRRLRLDDPETAVTRIDLQASRAGGGGRLACLGKRLAAVLHPKVVDLRCLQEGGEEPLRRHALAALDLALQGRALRQQARHYRHFAPLVRQACEGLRGRPRGLHLRALLDGRADGAAACQQQQQGEQEHQPGVAGDQQQRQVADPRQRRHVVPRAPCWPCSIQAFAASVTSPSSASSDATANAAWKSYSL